MHRSNTVCCPHCGAAMPRISVWQSIPGEGRPNYHCSDCGEDAWFPFGTRLLANFAMLLVISLGLAPTFGMFEMETRHPMLMSMARFMLLGFTILAGVWTSGRVCVGSAYLVRSNYESMRKRVRKKVAPQGKPDK